jgi:bacterioferritin
MQGKQTVLNRLNNLLVGELSAADQYFVHSRMLENWGFHTLYERIAHERMDELAHADSLIKRILFLEGTPDLSARAPLNIRAVQRSPGRSESRLPQLVTM